MTKKKLFRILFILIDLVMFGAMIFLAVNINRGDPYPDRMFAVLFILLISGYVLGAVNMLISFACRSVHGFCEYDSTADFFQKLMAAPFFILLRLVTRCMIVCDIEQDTTVPILYIGRQVITRVVFWAGEVMMGVGMFHLMRQFFADGGFFLPLIYTALMVYLFTGVGQTLHVAFWWHHGIIDYEDAEDFFLHLMYAPLTYLRHLVTHLLAIFGKGAEYDDYYNEYDTHVTEADLIAEALEEVKRRK